VPFDGATSAQQLFEKQISYGKPRDYLIRVNREPTAPTKFPGRGPSELYAHQDQSGDVDCLAVVFTSVQPHP
jgi:hypothetical protein